MRQLRRFFSFLPPLILFRCIFWIVTYCWMLNDRSWRHTVVGNSSVSQTSYNGSIMSFEIYRRYWMKGKWYYGHEKNWSSIARSHLEILQSGKIPWRVLGNLNLNLCRVSLSEKYSSVPFSAKRRLFALNLRPYACGIYNCDALPIYLLLYVMRQYVSLGTYLYVALYFHNQISS